MSILYPIRGRKLLYLAIDAVIVSASYAVSCIIRYYPHWGYPGMPDLQHYFALVAFYVVSYYCFQIYRVMWAYSNIADIYRLVLANVSGFILFFGYTLIRELYYLRVPVVMAFLFSTILSVFYRILIRDYYSRRGTGAGNGNAIIGSPRFGGGEKKILVIGAGEAGRIILSEYMKKGLGKLIAGLADDDRSKVGTILNGKMVFCASDGINRVIRDRSINEIIIAMPSVGSDKINRIASIIRREHRSIPIKVLPHVLELDERKPLTISLRDITIADLIGRDEVLVDTGMIDKKFSGKTILITGAGGSIGSEMCRQLLKFNIKKLVAVGRGEFSMYNLIKDLDAYAPFLEIRPEIVYRIVDIKDYRLMRTVFQEHRPDVVFNAAAHKHVPLMEFNEAEAMQNNVAGTINMLNLSNEYRAGEFVFISTDKAVHPTSIMGATKRIAEIITGFYHRTRNLTTSIVRFGNVIGSRGSVIPLFMEQIERGGPVTVTHPDVTRYFMSIPEASLLVISAAAYAKGGELFVLDMGRQYRVAEIAQRLIEFYGYRSDDVIKIEFTGLRPGEKLHEDLFYSDSKLIKTHHEKVYILSENDDVDRDRIEMFMEKDLPEISRYSPSEIRNIIKRIVPDFESDPGRNGSAPNKKLVS